MTEPDLSFEMSLKLFFKGTRSFLLDRASYKLQPLLLLPAAHLAIFSLNIPDQLVSGRWSSSRNLKSTFAEMLLPRFGVKHGHKSRGFGGNRQAQIIGFRIGSIQGF